MAQWSSVNLDDWKRNQAKAPANPVACGESAVSGALVHPEFHCVPPTLMKAWCRLS
jgi:hypothetical protein